ncbi:MAG: hypothetical protein KBC06_01465 [Candidatus Pacebacteria bacterium]|nr:hypothetical protein [Candidatus Paceibacterota bacterium]
MKKIKRLKFILPLTILFIGFFVAVNQASAVESKASIYFKAPSSVSIGETFEVAVNADTLGNLINSINVSINYDENLLSFAGYKDENTVVRIWIDSPHDDAGTISMSGIIPGGVSGLYDPQKKGISPTPIARLLFVAKGAGDADFSFLNTTILKHDGKGTALEHEKKNIIVAVKNIISPTTTNGAVDVTPPNIFDLSVISSSVFSETPDMIVFKAEDADSGIKKYQIKIGVGEWQDSNSPQPIAKSIFSRSVIVRAFDFYGNFQDANTVIPGILPSKLLVLMLVLLALSGILGFKLLKYKI